LGLAYLPILEFSNPTGIDCAGRRFFPLDDTYIFVAAMANGRERVEALFLQKESALRSYDLASMGTTPHLIQDDYDEHSEPNEEDTDSETHEDPSPTSRIASGASTVSRNSYTSNTSSQHSSTSTAPSSVGSTPPAPPSLNHQIATTPYDHGYNLPCEFACTGCGIKFHPTQIEAWIDHSMSHFGNFSPPSQAICTFCDEEDGIFRTRDEDTRGVWRDRMMHIATSHLQELQPAEGMRPDYFLLDYLRKIEVLSIEDYNYAIKYTERPPVDGLVDYGFEPKEVKMKKERMAHAEHNLEKERRQMRREKGKGKGAHKNFPKVSKSSDER
jgi:hypothetical protein